MKIVGYQICLRVTRFVILVIRPDYQKFCLRSTPDTCGSVLIWTMIRIWTQPFIYTTIGDACVCVFAKLDQFLPVRSHFDTKRPVNFFHIATFPSPTFGQLFAFHCPLFFTKNNNLQCRDVLKSNGDYPR